MNKKQRKQKLKKLNQVRKKGRQWWTMEDVLYHCGLIDYAKWKEVHNLRDEKILRQQVSREFALDFKPNKEQTKNILNKLKSL